MRWLISGAAGFLGYHFAHALSAQQESQLVLVDAHRHGVPDDAYLALCSQPNVERVDADLTNVESVRDLPEVDVVFHLAALNGTANFYDRPWQVVQDTSLSTLLLLDRYRSSGLQHWIYASSSEIYADGVQRFFTPVPTGEDIPLVFSDVTNPRWSYGYSKGLGEVATHAAFDSLDCIQTVLRFHNVFGPRMGTKHFIPDFLQRAVVGDYRIFGANQTRAYAYVDDIVCQVLSLLENSTNSHGTFNVGSAVERRNSDVALEILSLLHRSGKLIELPAPPGSVDRRCPDLRKITSIIGEREETPLREALRCTIASYL